MDRNNQASFARAFFKHLDAEGLDAAILHSYEDGFGGELSDIDFAVDQRSFTTLEARISEFAESRGWILCQALQHEISACYFVCCKRDEPEVAVALDACSDYRIRGRKVISAEDLLDGRQFLDWGGWAASREMEFRYRFVKAAAKRKKPLEMVKELSSLDVAFGQALRGWLDSQWDVSLGAWHEGEVAQALNVLSAKLERTKWSVDELRRSCSRCLSPCGLFLEVSAGQEEKVQRALRHCFRRTFTIGKDSPFLDFMRIFPWLMGAGLVVCPDGSIGGMAKLLLGRRLFHSGDAISAVTHLSNRRHS